VETRPANQWAGGIAPNGESRRRVASPVVDDDSSGRRFQRVARRIGSGSGDGNGKLGEQASDVLDGLRADQDATTNILPRPAFPRDVHGGRGAAPTAPLLPEATGFDAARLGSSAIDSVARAGTRVFVGEGVSGPEARLQITRGTLTGAEIQLRIGPCGVEAALLTRSESSRQTLCLAMQEVAHRLRKKGFVLRVSARLPARSDVTTASVDDAVDWPNDCPRR
jgi:hypothetical protein